MQGLPKISYICYEHKYIDFSRKKISKISNRVGLYLKPTKIL